MERNSNTLIIAIVALLIAVIALIASWIAYNRGGANLEEQISGELEQATQEAVQDIEIAGARIEARNELLALRARLEGEENYEEATEELSQILGNLEDAYQNTSAEARATFSNIRTEFTGAEQALREGTSDALEVLGGLILLLGEDARTDEE